MTIEKVLIVDPEPSHRALLQTLLQKKTREVFLTSSSSEAIDQLKTQVFDLVICDLKVPTLGGLEVLKSVKALHPHALFILITSVAQGEDLAHAMRLGAFNYLLKPLSASTIEPMLDRVQEHMDLLEENHYLREEISTQQGHKKCLLIAESQPMKNILSDVGKIAKSSASVFISGESGTGKEVIAHAIHALSHRANQPFIKVNCAAIAPTLLESEFFGHEKGAFTGAIHKKLGRFELADRGTLLLDEVSEIPLELQSKLLRAVQEMEFERVGGMRPLCVDTRLISTSNRSMKEAVEQKLFREDLYYRLNVVPVHLPPLRERREDILPLAEFFLKRLCEENQKPIKRLCASAQEKLTHYHWPGNIRELANVIERTVVMNATDIIEAHHVYIDLSCPIKEAPSSPFACGMTLAQMEKKLILETLTKEKNNRTKTAQVLGISIRTLRNKLHAYSRQA
jgi:two-component system, NtrC family, response regulator AtoC